MLQVEMLWKFERSENTHGKIGTATIYLPACLVGPYSWPDNEDLIDAYHMST